MTSFTQEKAILRAHYKWYKCGARKWEDIPPKYQKLLQKYYGVK